MRARLRGVVLALGRLGLLGRGCRPTPLRGAWLRAELPERLATVGLLVALVAYLLAWGAGSREWLAEPLLQADDARTHLFPFHRHARPPALVDDPVADDMLAQVPPAFRLAYAALVPVVGLLPAAKVVQFFALALIGVAGWLTARRRGGWAVGFLLVALALHHGFVVNRVAGGLQRSFSIPLLLLFASGVIDRAATRRTISAIAAALVYPPAMLLVLTAEGLLFLARSVDPRRASVRRGALRLGALGVTCLALTLLSGLPGRHAGAVPTRAQAEMTGAFGQDGRTRQLPFADAGQTLTWHASLHFVPGPNVTEERWPVAWTRAQGSALALACWTLVVLAVATGLAERPLAGTALVGAGVLVHLLARWLAFRLYAPERYLAHAMAAGGIALLAMALGGLVPRWDRGRRAVVRAVAAISFLALLVGFTGLGAAGSNGLRADARQIGALVEALRALPVDARVTAHPRDADHAPLWAGRAAVVGVETLIPWRLDAWERQLQAARETLDALYATERSAVLRHAEARGVTHLLLRTDRYGAAHLPGRALLFAPLDEHVRELLRGVDPRSHVLARVPPEAVTWSDGPWILVDVSRLAEAWSS